MKNPKPSGYLFTTDDGQTEFVVTSSGLTVRETTLGRDLDDDEPERVILALDLASLADLVTLFEAAAAKFREMRIDVEVGEGSVPEGTAADGDPLAAKYGALKDLA